MIGEYRSLHKQLRLSRQLDRTYTAESIKAWHAFFDIKSMRIDLFIFSDFDKMYDGCFFE